MNDLQSRQYLFADFLIDCGTHQLLRAGQAIALTPKEFRTLLVFLEADGRAVEREAMIRAIWPDTIVGDTSLARNISVLRRHLGPGSIELVPRFGYRFVPQVSQRRKASAIMAAEAPVEPRSALPEPEVEPAGEMPSPESETTQPLSSWRAAGKPRLAGPWMALPVGALVVVLVATVLMEYKRRVLAANQAAVSRPAATVTHLAILPFKNLSPAGQSSDYLRDGILDDLIARLSQIDPAHVRVIGATTSAQYGDTTRSIQTIGREIGAQYVLEGSVEFEKEELHLRANLVDTQDATVVFSEVFDGPRDRLEAEDETIVERIGSVPRLYLGPWMTTLTGAPETITVQAQDEYLLGRSEMARNDRESYERALEHFQRAVQLDPRYARALAGIAEAYIYRTDTLPLEFCYTKARAAALAAIALDANLAEAHRDLAYVDFAEQNDSHNADEEFKLALRLAPQDARAHSWYATALASEGRAREAEEEARRGADLDPQSPRMLAQLGFLLAQTDKFGEGIRLLQRSLEIDPQSEMAWGYLGIAYLRAGKFPEAARAFDRAAGFEAFSASYLADAAFARSKANDPTEARRLHETFARKLARHEWLPSQALAIDEIALGNNEAAVRWVKNGLKDKTIFNSDLKEQPFYTAVKDDPYFHTVLAKQ